MKEFEVKGQHHTGKVWYDEQLDQFGFTVFDEKGQSILCNYDLPDTSISLRDISMTLEQYGLYLDHHDQRALILERRTARADNRAGHLMPNRKVKS